MLPAKTSSFGNQVASSSKPVLQLLETAFPTLDKGKEKQTYNVQPWSGSDLSSLSSLSSSPTENKSTHIPSPILKRESLTFQEPAKLAEKLELQVGSGSRREWSVDGLGVYVWVLLETKSWKVVEDQDTVDETIWWPGLLEKPTRAKALKVKLFGNSSKQVKVKKPHATNILSRLDSQGIHRFTSYESSRSSTALESLLASPRKKPKLGKHEKIRDLWESAAHEMRQHAEEDAGSDHLPDVAEAFVFTPFSTLADVGSKNPPEKSRKGKRRRQSGSESEPQATLGSEEEGDPPPWDGNMNIPGELVLGREKELSDYWPAKILGYLPPIKRKRKEGLYKVEWVDGTQGEIPRRWFYCFEENQFGDCKLGALEHLYPDQVNDEAAEEPLSRSSSPIPSDTPPLDFGPSGMSIRQQFACTKNVLIAILNENYPPAREKHDLFLLKDPKARRRLQDSASRRGMLDGRSVNLLQRYLSRWCLRDEGRAAKPDDGALDIFPEADVVTERTTASQEVNGQLLVALDDDMHSGFDSPTSKESHMFPPPRDSSFSPSEVPDRDSSPLLSEPSLALGASLSGASSAPSVSATEPETNCDTVDHSMADVDDLTNERQRGCERYEALDEKDRVQYCVDVLLPEAIRQILLWRSGDRKSIALLSEDEEMELYEKGENLLEERDWVTDVLILRKKRKEQNEKEEERERTKEMARAEANGKVVRPKRRVGRPSYAD